MNFPNGFVDKVKMDKHLTITSNIALWVLCQGFFTFV